MLRARWDARARDSSWGELVAGACGPGVGAW